MAYGEGADEGQENDGQTRNAFRDAEKKYQLFREQKMKMKNGRQRAGKLVTCPTDLSEVLDLHDATRAQETDVVRRVLPDYPGAVYTFTRHPGLVYLPAALPPDQHRQLLHAALTDFPHPPARTNHNLQYGPLPGLWRAAEQGLRLNWARRDDPRAGPQTRRMGCEYTTPAAPKRPLPSCVTAAPLAAASPPPPLPAANSGPEPEAPAVRHYVTLQGLGARGMEEDWPQCCTSPPPSSGGGGSRSSTPDHPARHHRRSSSSGSSRSSCSGASEALAEEFEELRLRQLQDRQQQGQESCGSKGTPCGPRPQQLQQHHHTAGGQQQQSWPQMREFRSAESGSLRRGREQEAEGPAEGERGGGRDRMGTAQIPHTTAAAVSEVVAAGAASARAAAVKMGPPACDGEAKGGDGGPTSRGLDVCVAVRLDATSPSFTECWSPCGAGPVAEQLVRKLRWATLGPQFDWTQRQYDFCVPYRPLPGCLGSLARQLAAVVDCLQGAGLGVMPPGAARRYQPDAAIVNYYQQGDVLGGHLDDVERNMALPIVSVSLGCPAVFLMGAPTKQLPPTALLLRGGDVLVLAGEARRCYHGVPRVLDMDAVPHLPPPPCCPAPGPHDPYCSHTAPCGLSEHEWSPHMEAYARVARINISVRAVG